jgi:hypothetical protein
VVVDAEFQIKAEDSAQEFIEEAETERLNKEAQAVRLAEEVAKRVAAEAEVKRVAEEARIHAAENGTTRLAQEETKRRVEEEAVKRVAEEAEAGRMLEEEALSLAQEEARKVVEEAVDRRLTEENTQRASKRLGDEESKRLSKEEAKAQKLAEEAKAKNFADEEVQRFGADVEAKGLADKQSQIRVDEAEAKRLAEEEAQRLAEEAVAKRFATDVSERLAEKEATRAQRMAEEAQVKRLDEDVRTKMPREESEARGLTAEAYTQQTGEIPIPETEEIGRAVENPTTNALGAVMEKVKKRKALLLERQNRRQTVDLSLTYIEQINKYEASNSQSKTGIEFSDQTLKSISDNGEMSFENIKESWQQEMRSSVALTDGEINELNALLDAQEEGIPIDETRLYDLELLDRYCLGDQLSRAQTEDLHFVLKRRDRFQRHTKEYNDLLEMQEAGEDIDGGRLYLLELVVRRRLPVGESLTSEELGVVANFDALEEENDTSVDGADYYIPGQPTETLLSGQPLTLLEEVDEEDSYESNPEHSSACDTKCLSVQNIPVASNGAVKPGLDESESLMQMNDKEEDIDNLYELELLNKEKSGKELTKEERKYLTFFQERARIYEGYAKEYDDLLDKQEQDKKIDTIRLHSLELVLKCRLGESLTDEEFDMLDAFEMEEEHVRNENGTGEDPDTRSVFLVFPARRNRRRGIRVISEYQEPNTKRMDIDGDKEKAVAVGATDTLQALLPLEDRGATLHDNFQNGTSSATETEKSPNKFFEDEGKWLDHDASERNICLQRIGRKGPYDTRESRMDEAYHPASTENFSGDQHEDGTSFSCQPGRHHSRKIEISGSFWDGEDEKKDCFVLQNESPNSISSQQDQESSELRYFDITKESNTIKNFVHDVSEGGTRSSENNVDAIPLADSRTQSKEKEDESDFKPDALVQRTPNKLIDDLDEIMDNLGTSSIFLV